MKRTWLAGAAGAAMLVSTALAHPSATSDALVNVAEDLKGKLCTTRSGTYLHFASDGHYGYDGLWRNAGHYVITREAVTIRLDNGLERSYPIRMQDGILYMGRVALNCEEYVAQVADVQ